MPYLWEVSDDNKTGWDGKASRKIVAFTSDGRFWTADSGSERHWHPTIRDGHRLPDLANCPKVDASSYLGPSAKGGASSEYGANRAYYKNHKIETVDDQTPRDPSIKEFRTHMGTDYESLGGDGLAAPRPFYSPVSGTVQSIDDHYNRIVVQVGDGTGRALEFLHASKVLVKKGDAVQPGQQLGVTGQKDADEIHLHVQARDAKGLPIDPSCVRPQPWTVPLGPLKHGSPLATILVISLGLVVVAVGWYLATPHPNPGRPDRPVTPNDGSVASFAGTWTVSGRTCQRSSFGGSSCNAFSPTSASIGPDGSITRGTLSGRISSDGTFRGTYSGRPEAVTGSFSGDRGHLEYHSAGSSSGEDVYWDFTR